MSSGCSIQNCGEQELKFFNPPLCERHWEIVLLASRVERQGLPVTADNLIATKARSVVRWLIQDDQIPQLLLDVQAVPA